MERSVFDVNFDEPLKIITHPDLDEARERLRNELESFGFTSHFAIFSSGTSSRELKGYILSDKAMAANAAAVNEWFSLTSQDVWGLSLPVYHVGGLSVLMRAKLLGNKVIDLRKWEPLRWQKTLADEKVSITTIVPTQLYDLVKNDLKAPPSLRYLVVGGDFLAEELETRARALGWPVIRTFGMTEVCSQLASGKDPGDKLSVLPIHQVKTTSDGILEVKSPSLFTAVFILKEKLTLSFAPEDFYRTQDKIILKGNVIIPQGRQNQEIKVAGHLTSILSLKDTLASVLLKSGSYGKAELMIEHDDRKGSRLVLVHTGLEQEILETIKAALKPSVFDEIRPVQNFPRTELGKLKS